MVFVSGVSILAYAHGVYSIVLTLGLAVNIPRTLFYISLTPGFGEIGTSCAYLLGSITGLAGAVYLAGKMSFKMSPREHVILIGVPAILSLTSYLADLPLLLGAPMILVLSAITYTRLRIITKKDLKELIEAVAPREILLAGIQRFHWLVRLLFGEG